MASDARVLTIAFAGNTENPCLLALRAKGYAIAFAFTQTADGHQRELCATKDGRSFYASNGAELLGLVAVWEIRGDDWRTQPGEANVCDECYPNSRTYDGQGNLIEVGDTPIR